MRTSITITNVSWPKGRSISDEMCPPALFVKAATTLDVLWPGRVWFGVGASYRPSGADNMGIHLPPTLERFQWLEDTRRLARRIWSGGTRSIDMTDIETFLDTWAAAERDGDAAAIGTRGAPGGPSGS
jgi:alkanesulfonate monooxygenase SsuD/methylene tetrahydromethanopterin reductase-like flavin-dependent oxidoreductase (luciferase family)